MSSDGALLACAAVYKIYTYDLIHLLAPRLPVPVPVVADNLACNVIAVPGSWRPGLGFRQFGRFEGLAKSDQQKCTKVYRKYADLGHDIQVGYEHFGSKWKTKVYRSVQKCTAIFRWGTGTLDIKKVYKVYKSVQIFMSIFRWGTSSLKMLYFLYTFLRQDLASRSWC